MMNTKMGIVFTWKKDFNKEILEVLRPLLLLDVTNYDTEEWFINLSVLMIQEEVIC